jgi:hypothetical protein
MTLLARTAPKPVAGTCRLVRRIAWPFPGILEINRTEYTIIPLAGPSSGEDAAVIGYRLLKRDGRTAYDVDAERWTCDCPDATYCPRPGGCKHSKALRTALQHAQQQPTVTPAMAIA